MEKLVRDKIPELLASQNIIFNTRQASNQEFWHLLFIKLQEEIVEFAQNPTVEELADIIEVVYALGAICNISETKIALERMSKKAAKGSFNDRVVLIKGEQS